MEAVTVTATDSLGLVASTAIPYTVDAGFDVHEMVNFTQGNNWYGLKVAGDLIGQGSGVTSYVMKPMSSTRASTVPAQATLQTNPLALVSIDTPKRVAGFTVTGTPQGHLYGGWRVNKAPDVVIEDLVVTSIPGDNGGPPGETFGGNVWQSPRAIMRRCKASGLDAAGKVVAASLFGINNCDSMVLEDNEAAHSWIAHAFAFWQSRDLTIRGGFAKDVSYCGYHFERCAGTIRLDRVRVERCVKAHMTFDNDQESAKVIITDPIFDGPKLRVQIHDRYPGASLTQKQLKSDIKLFIGGVERPDLLSLANNW